MKFKYCIFLIIVFLTGCNFRETLEPKFFVDRDIKLINENGNSYLNIKGFCFHSALMVEDIKEFKNNDSLRVIVYLTPFGYTASKYKKNGREFEYKVKIDKDINKVLFGRKGEIIWEKNQKN